MENNEDLQNTPPIHPPVEHHYEEHAKEPGPSPEAMYDRQDEGAGEALKWILPPLILMLIITWLLFLV